MSIYFRLSRIRLHPFFTDVLLTGVTQVLILVTGLIMVSLVSKWMGLVALGEYLLLKRVSAWLLTGTQLGLGLALPREIAHTREESAERASRYFAVAFVTIVPILAVMSLIAVLTAKTVARLCFGSENRDLVYALVWLLAGSGLQTIVFGYYRGLQRMHYANVVQLGGLVVVPLLVLVAIRSSHSAALLVEMTGIGLTAMSIVWSLPLFCKAKNFKSHFVSDAGRLLRYGVVRVPGDIANGALLALGPVMVSHCASVEQLSYLLLGITCLGITSLAFWPVVMMLLAKISKMLGMGRTEDVIIYVQHLRSAVVQLSVLVMTQALIFIGPLVRWWLGDSYLSGVPVICIIMLAIPGYMYFCAMRSVLDAASAIPYNTRSVILALAVFCVISLTVTYAAPREWVLLWVSATMTIAFYVLAIATEWSLRAVKLVVQAPQMSPMLIVALLAFVSLSAQFAFHFEITKTAFCLVLLFNVGLTLMLIRQSQPEWVTFMSRVALSRA